jgi:hypothetical protein
MTSSDDASRAARWLDAGLMDVPFYAALRGREFGSPEEAAEDFVTRGMAQRLSPHPFLDFVSLPSEVRRLWRRGKVGQVVGHLTGEDGRVHPVGPLSSPEDPSSARAGLLRLATELGREASGIGEALPGIDWSHMAERPGRAGLTSVVVIAAEVRPTVQAVQILLRHAPGHDVEVVVVDHGSAPHVALGLHAALNGRPGLSLVRVPGNVSAAAAANAGLARAAGEVVVLLQAHVQLRRDWLPGLLAALADPDVAGVQPVLLGPDDTIASSGLVVLAPGAAPVPLLVGHPPEDARRLQQERLAAISGDAMVLRRVDVVALGGLDPALPWAEAALDLCVRLSSRRTAGFRVSPKALASDSRGDESPDVVVLPPHPGLAVDPEIHERIGFAPGRARAQGRLRWSLRLPSAAGHGGDRWGDTHFADALADALRGLGQDVVTRRRGAHTAGPTHLDDVALAIRGLYPIPPTPGQVNVLWVISHPDDVQPDELEGYDLVFAASHPWSRALSSRAGREVVPLLQATEFELPVAGSRSTAADPGVVFVGAASQDRDRPLVRMAVEARVPLSVYGPGWQSLPEGVWRGEYVDNRELPALYHRHGIVLADHWPDMARHGFVANRVFDAVASGARVICDDVAGVHDVFDPRDVLVARAPEEVAAAFAQFSASAAHGDVPRPELSFDDRARTLLDGVRALAR